MLAVGKTSQGKDVGMTSFFKADDSSFVFIGKDDTNTSVWGRIDEIHGFSRKESSTEEFGYLTRIEQEE